MVRDERVFLLGEDIAKHGGAFGVTRTLFDQFGPERVRNTPISENTIVGAATGAALVGMRPVAEIMFVDFSGLAMDQIATQAAKLRFMTGGQCAVPWVLRMPQGGGAGKSTAAQHSQSLEVWFAHIPGLKVVLPSTPYDAKGLMKAAIRDDNPVVFLEHKLLYSFRGLVPDEDYVVPLSQCDVKRVGRDVTVVASGYMVWHAMLAAQILAPEGIDVEVVDVRTIAPLDEATIGDLGSQDRARGGGRRGGPPVRPGQRVGDGRDRARRAAQGTRRPGRRAQLADPVRQQPRAWRVAGHGGRRRGHPPGRPHLSIPEPPIHRRSRSISTRHARRPVAACEPRPVRPVLDGRLATVGDEVPAGGIRTLVRREPQVERRNLLRLTRPAHRNPL